MTLPDPTTAPPWWDTPTQATAAEFLDWLMITSPENVLWYWERISEAMNQGHRCWEFGHEDTIDTLRRQLSDARQRVAWLEKNYMEQRGK